MKSKSTLERKLDWSSYIVEKSSFDPEILFRKGIQFPKLTLEKIKETTGTRDIDSILELGCSAGYWGKLIEDQIGHRLDKNGVDDNETILKFNFLDNYFVSDVLSFQTEKRFDLVFSLGLFEHFSKPEREKLFAKHCEFSREFIVIGFPNVSFSLRYFCIKFFDDFLGGYHHFRVEGREVKSLAVKFGLTVLWSGYLANNYYLQKYLKLKEPLHNNFFLDYFLVVLEKKDDIGHLFPK